MAVRYVEPVSQNLTFAEISHLAELVASELGFEFGGDVIQAVEQVGGRVVYEDFWDLKKSDSGSIRVEPSGTFVITLPNHTSEARDRFTIGHELGHWALHFGLPKTSGQFEDGVGLEAKRYGDGPTEVEANWFAASFLMPKEAFGRAFEECGGNIELLAERFRVSSSAAAVRAKVLRLG